MGIGAGTAATISLAATAASAAIGTIGAITKSNADADAAKFQAQVSANDAIIKQQQSQTTAAAGEQQATTQALKTRATVGAIRAFQGSSGLDINSGSAVDVRSSQAMLGMQDQLTIRSNAAREAYGYQVGAVSNTAQSELLRKQAAGQGTAGLIGAAGSLLSGASSVGNNYAKFRTSGVFGGSSRTNDDSMPLIS